MGHKFFLELESKKIDKQMKSFNATCQNEGYDYASPILTDHKIEDFNCCKYINESSANCIIHQPNSSNFSSENPT